jgi:hypothetical protein
MMKSRTILFLVLACLLLSSLPGFAAPRSTAAATETPADYLLSELEAIQKKKVTLVYLADPRTKAFLSELITDLPPLLKKNFRANITGSYRKVILENYAVKQEELSNDLSKLLHRMPESKEKVFSTLENSSFPLNLGFSALARKLADKAMFGMSQKGNDELIPEAKRDFDRLQVVMQRMTKDADRDAFEAVKAMYAETSVRNFPLHWYDDLQHRVDYITHGETPEAPQSQGRKKWTVLVFLNADNDLEQAGLADINEMEKVGSNDNLNIVVQVDRMDGGAGDAIADANWVGTRRYYIKRDFTKKIVSPMVMNLGERDMGSRRELAEFLKWGIETYPADRFVAVIWNHGAGWMGISSDDDSGKMLSVPDVMAALREAKPALEKVNPRHPRFDIVDFDACLMGMLEIAYELRDLTDYMVGSEENEPGAGMPYRETLSPIRENPDITPRAAAKNFVEAYVRSYSLGGSATNKRVNGAAVTKAAYDLSKIVPLAKKVGELGALLQERHEVYSQLLVDEYGQFAKIRRYSEESYVDLLDFCFKLAQIESLPEEARKICLEIVALLGYPKLEDRLAQPVIIKRRTPGQVIWGVNGWRLPATELCPPGSKVFRTRFIRTPLRGPDAKGDFTCAIGPFSLMKDPVDGKRKFIKELNYKIEYNTGKTSPEMTVKTGREYQIITQFPTYSPLIAEGHTQGMGNSFGLSIYYPYCLEFRTSYKALQFAKDFAWDEFISKIPRYTRHNNILLTGAMVEDPNTLLYFVDGLKRLNLTFDILWDPKVFGYRFRDILATYRDGAVFTDSISLNSFGKTTPSADDLIHYLEQGGSLFIAAQSAEQQNNNMHLLEEYFRFSYVDDDRDLPSLRFPTDDPSQEILLNGAESARSAGDVTIMQTADPAQPFLLTTDGRTAGIAVQGTTAGGNKYRGVYLGFRFEAVTGAETRAELLKNVWQVLSSPSPRRNR